MTNFGLGHITRSERRGSLSRGIARTGLPLLSYGFRPFFLGAGLFAIVAMAAWIGALTWGWEIGSGYGLVNWHAHEMLFGYTSAAMAGFMLTAIPNWTGRLPVSGTPLLGLVVLWLAGRVAIAVPHLIGLPASMLADAVFLPSLAFIAGREVIAGKNWRNLKVLGGAGAIALANAGFHASVLANGEAALASRFAVSIYVLLVALIAGRIVPSFTRNWLVKRGSAQVPAPFDRLDVAAIIALGLGLFAWTATPNGLATVVLVGPATLLNAWRLARWRGWMTLEEPLLVMLHLAYAFVPLGMASIGLAAIDWIAAPSALHVLTVGCIGSMTVAVMARASLAHTGRVPVASWTISLCFLALIVAAVSRPFAELLPEHYHLLLGVSGGSWLLSFALFVAELGPKLVARSVSR